MLGILEAKTLAYHCNGQRLIVQQLFGMGEEAICDNILGSSPRFHAHQISEVAAGKVAFICKSGHSG